MVSLFQFALALVGAIFGAGIAYATMKGAIHKAQSDVNKIGGLSRDNVAVQDRRWLFEIADAAEEADTIEKRTRLAARIRNEAFRH
jgi:hypothetical protein